jgi:polar amino acid transport system substrate-binding protein
MLCLGFGLSAAAQAADALRFGLDENGFPPLYFRPADSERGVYELIFDEATKLTGDRYIPIFLPQKRKFKMFEDREIDIEPGVNPDWRKPQQAISLYSIPFADSEDVLLYHAEDRRSYYKVADLKGRTLGCIVGYAYPELEKRLASGEIKRDDSKDREMMIQKLVKRRVDAIILPRTVAEYWQKLNDKEKRLKFGAAVSSRPISFRFHVKKKAAMERFDKALKQLIDKGKIKEIFAGFR